jgi:ankyrin repeat protein
MHQVELLLRKQADVAARDKQKETALHLAAAQGHASVAVALLDAAPSEIPVSTSDSVCAHCAKKNDSETKLRLCLGCKLEYYCSTT